MRVTTRRIEPVGDPLARRPDVVWMSPGTSLWGWGQAALIRPGPGDDRIERMRSQFVEIAGQVEIEPDLEPGEGLVAFASLTFSTDSAESVAVVPEVVVGRREDRWWMTAVDGARLPPVAEELTRAPDRTRYAGSSVPDVSWLEAVATAVKQIGEGRLDKVVLARDYAVWSRRRFDPPRLLRHLSARFPRCHRFSVAGLVGASPELLVRRMGSVFESVVLAGTAPVFDDPDTDARAGAALVASEKDRWEHLLAVESVRSALAPVTSTLSVPDTPQLLRLDNVRHLASPVSGVIEIDCDALSLADRLHPTAAVGGTPRQVADVVIREIEGMDRGRYAGPVGWMDAAGDGEFAIALRCAQLSGARARLFAGAGIVAGSLPESELEETRIKLKAMMGALEA